MVDFQDTTRGVRLLSFTSIDHLLDLPLNFIFCIKYIVQIKFCCMETTISRLDPFLNQILLCVFGVFHYGSISLILIDGSKLIFLDGFRQN